MNKKSKSSIIISRTPEPSDSSGSVNRMQEYLTGLSEQYSAFQTLMGQTAAIQQLQAAMTASAASQSASNTQALAQQAALAQYMQQVAAASGSSSSSSTSPNKNLNMLSNMAQLTNYQAMMSMMMGGSSGGHTASAPPRRGRGSRQPHISPPATTLEADPQPSPLTGPFRSLLRNP